MNARQSHSPAPGPDLLARYLNAYLQARQLSDVERPWGLGDDNLDELWARLTDALGRDPKKLNRIVADELKEADRVQIVEALVPLIFALPIRSYPGELRVVRSGLYLVLSMRHLDGKDGGVDCIGFLPSALTGAFNAYVRRVLRLPDSASRAMVTISSGGRRRRVRLTILAHERGIVARFLERLPSPADH